ncbi:MAG: hypothetical protein CUN55_06065 [Phototrophicales bacterium]|nr:MAG: hypothetical protein CUN55_06065 [Phototrophicales bacterium]
MSNSSVTLEESFRIYQQQANFRSQHTLLAYRRAVELFFDFLDDRSAKILPIQHKTYVTARQLSTQDFSAQDQSVLLHFAQWLAQEPHKPKRSDKRPYAFATIELRVAGVHHWLSFIQSQGWLPEGFDLAVAYQQYRDNFLVERSNSHVVFVDDLSPLVRYYDHLEPPRHLLKDEARLARWELVRLRNRAFLHCLADTGGRVSELLSLNVGDIPTGSVLRKTVTITVVGKSNHPYEIHIQSALPTIRAYIFQRKTPKNDEPLFISHDQRYEGARMSRVVAWRIVRRAAKALGMGEVSPQMFRHWRALQLIASGATPQEVRDILGHRSLETVRSLYADAWSQQNTQSNIE